MDKLFLKSREVTLVYPLYFLFLLELALFLIVLLRMRETQETGFLRNRVLEIPGTIAHQAPPSMGFSRQEYWSGLLFPSPGDLPDPGTETRSPPLRADALPTEVSGKPRDKTGEMQSKEDTRSEERKKNHKILNILLTSPKKIFILEH